MFSLLHPLESMRTQRPFKGTAILCLTLAFLGSFLFGWSIAQAAHWPLVGTGVWMTVSAGAGWAALMPALTVAGAPASKVFRACLLAIAYGEMVLIAGAALNLLGFTADSPIYWNGGFVAISNVVMAAALTTQLKIAGVPGWKTLLLWVVALDGVGALFFWLLYKPLVGGA